jgi:hypothetical protein
MGWDGMGWDGIGWDGMGWDGMGWDGMGWVRVFISRNSRVLCFPLCPQGGRTMYDANQTASLTMNPIL